MTVEQLAKEVLIEKKMNVKRSTCEVYGYIMPRILNRFGDIDISALTYNDVQNLLNDCYTQGLAKSTIKKRKQVINDIANLAIKKGLIENNPCSMTVIPKNAFVGERRDLTTEEKNILMKSRKCPFANYALLLYYTGLRSSEAIPLKWADICLEVKEIKVSRVVTYAKGKSYIDNFTKNKDKYRIIPISDKLMEVLQAIPKLSPEWVFVNRNGKMMARNTVREKWSKFQTASGLTEVTPHMMRHTFATNLYRANIDLKTIQKITGHHDVQVLLKKYIHDDMEIVKNSVNLMNTYYDNMEKDRNEIA